jgi:hypothetical protein
MRPHCLECVRKHLGSAIVVMVETLTGYPEHITYVAGELDQAVQEAIHSYPELALKIRRMRIEYEDAMDRLLTGTPLTEVLHAMPDVQQLVLELHQLLLVELTTNRKDNSITDVNAT